MDLSWLWVPVAVLSALGLYRLILLIIGGWPDD